MASMYTPQNLYDVSSLVAVVTGGGAGLGLIIAKTLEANGAKVYITGRRPAVLEEAAKSAAHGNIIPITGDVTVKEDVQKAVDFITKDCGYIDVLVNNAGISTRDTDPNARPTIDWKNTTPAEVRDYYFNYRPDQVWKDVLNTNVSAVFTTSMAFLELLDAGNKRRAKDLPTSQIIAIGSTGGLTRGTETFIYNASKAAVHHLMKNMGTYFIPFDIRTNLMCPGWFPSDMTVRVQEAYKDSPMPKELVPRQRMGTPDEFAGTILYLVSKAGGYCNGASMVIEGGFLANHPGI